jgi:diguanylate cyclase (GGDEF)-like protein/PAS domain S-box-containing protein
MISNIEQDPLLIDIAQQLAEREELFRAIFNQSPIGIELIDPDTLQFVEANPAACRMLGYTYEEFLRLRLIDTQADSDETVLAEGVHQLAASGGAIFENRHRCKNGDILDVEINASMLNLPGKRLLVGVWRDITGSKRAEENLRITASVFDNSHDAILITDADNTIVDVNPAFTQITGYSREEVIGKNPRLLGSGRQDKALYAAMWQSLQQNKSWRGELWNRRKSGKIYAGLLSISTICDDNGRVQRHVGVFSDITHLKAHEAELSRVAHYDALTGIPNRVLLAERMKQAIAQAAREQNMMSVCYLDLDGFKPINDSMGHEAGDQVLIEVARRIENTIRSGDTVARLGGDEFVVLLRQDKGEECVATLKRLLAAVAQPISVKNKSHTLSASIGVSIYPLDDEDPDTLLRHADQAMYVAKQSGKNRFHIYDPTLDMRARKHHEFMESIHHGLLHGQFELHYQPKINLRTQQLVGAEALIRWRHPERGLLSPAEFLRPIENTELDIEIGDWVIAAALAQVDCWRRAGLDIEVSINISAYHLESFRFTEKLWQKLARYPGLPPGKLQIEVLETAALNDLAIVREIIEACRKFGVGFALDDFGTGYSSLSYLSILPVDVLKIDQTFVRGMLNNKGDMAIVQGIIALARAFERQTVAEGIETEAHYRALLDMGCEAGQGYGIARPMPADELRCWKVPAPVITRGDYGMFEQPQSDPEPRFILTA